MQFLGLYLSRTTSFWPVLDKKRHVFPSNREDKTRWRIVGSRLASLVDWVGCNDHLIGRTFVLIVGPNIWMIFGTKPSGRCLDIFFFCNYKNILTPPRTRVRKGGNIIWTLIDVVVYPTTPPPHQEWFLCKLYYHIFFSSFDITRFEFKLEILKGDTVTRGLHGLIQYFPKISVRIFLNVDLVFKIK